MSWQEDQDFENDWWGNCANTYGEEEKQLLYAKCMGIKRFHNTKSPFNYDLKGIVLDIGGGPCSMLLKSPLILQGSVVDPCKYPDWVEARYDIANIIYYKVPAEEFLDLGTIYDEVLIYNVLQHTVDPSKIISNALAMSRQIRIFEWIENGISPGHPHNLTAEKLNEWLKGNGKVEVMNTPTCKGKAYYGVFKGEYYEPSN